MLIMQPRNIRISVSKLTETERLLICILMVLVLNPSHFSNATEMDYLKNVKL
jgi:hypothetical protein